MGCCESGSGTHGSMNISEPNQDPLHNLCQLENVCRKFSLAENIAMTQRGIRGTSRR